MKFWLPSLLMLLFASQCVASEHAIHYPSLPNGTVLKTAYSEVSRPAAAATPTSADDRLGSLPAGVTRLSPSSHEATSLRRSRIADHRATVLHSALKSNRIAAAAVAQVVIQKWSSSPRRSHSSTVQLESSTSSDVTSRATSMRRSDGKTMDENQCQPDRFDRLQRFPLSPTTTTFTTRRQQSNTEGREAARQSAVKAGYSLSWMRQARFLI